MPYCGSCKEECTAIEVDFGIGAYEFWGARGYDSRVEIVSDCCESPMYEDEDLCEPYENERYEDYDPDDYYDDYLSDEEIDNIADRYHGF